MATTEWWQTFFSGLFLDLWRAAVPPEQTRTEADFLQRVLAVPEGGRILDVPCGTGRLALELAGRGFRTTGIDIAEPYVREATATARDKNLPAEFHLQEMRDLPWAGAFDAAFCMGNSFGYLDDAGNAAFLKKVAECLKPGGRFALNSGYVAECLLPGFQDRRWYKIGDIYFLSQATYDFGRGRLETEYTLMRDGQVETKPASARIYNFREIRDLLTQAGFTDIEAASGLQGEPLKLGCPGVYFTARKT